MADQSERSSWQRISEVVRAGNRQQLETFIESLSSGETALAISRLEEEDRVQLLRMLSPLDAAELIEDLPRVQAVDLLTEMLPTEAAAVVAEMGSARRADALGELKAEDAEAILGRMDPHKAAEARELLAYPPDTAGGLMITEYLKFSELSTVQDVMEDLRTHTEKYADYQVQYVYIVSPQQKLLGVVRLRDLLLASAEAPITSVMIEDPFSVPVDASWNELQQFFRQHAFLAIPVIQPDGRLVGVARRDAVDTAARHAANRSFLKISGILGGEELRSMPFQRRSLRRLSWLSVNILLNILAASVIAFYQDTLSAAITLAVFLPIISDMSGCSGNQAVAVSIREITLGLVGPREFLRVFGKEISIGLANGFALGLLLGGTALLWKGNPYLGLVAGGALALNTVLAVSLGGLLPLLLRRFQIDPAVASGPILTTVTDMCGFFFVLSFATVVLPQLAT